MSATRFGIAGLLPWSLIVVGLGVTACGGSDSNGGGSAGQIGNTAGSVNGGAATGGSATGAAGTASGSGGASPGTSGSGGSSAGSGGSSAGTGGTAPGTGGTSAGSGGANAGSGGTAPANGGAAGGGGRSGAGGTNQGNGGRSGAGGQPATGGAGGAGASLTLTSTALANDATFMPAQTCAGTNLSPPLSWTAGPAQTQSYAIVLIDTSITRYHWAIWNMPTTVTSLPASLPAGASITAPVSAMQAITGAATPMYQGPCPNGNVHTYVFTVYALDVATLPGLGAGVMAQDVFTAIQSHVLAKGTLSGTSDAARP